MGEKSGRYAGLETYNYQRWTINHQRLILETPNWTTEGTTEVVVICARVARTEAQIVGVRTIGTTGPVEAVDALIGLDATATADGPPAVFWKMEKWIGEVKISSSIFGSYCCDKIVPLFSW